MPRKCNNKHHQIIRHLPECDRKFLLLFFIRDQKDYKGLLSMFDPQGEHVREQSRQIPGYGDRFSYGPTRLNNLTNNAQSSQLHRFTKMKSEQRVVCEV